MTPPRFGPKPGMKQLHEDSMGLGRVGHEPREVAQTFPR
jgi:hypothetical protein